MTHSLPSRRSSLPLRSAYSDVLDVVGCVASGLVGRDLHAHGADAGEDIIDVRAAPGDGYLTVDRAQVQAEGAGRVLQYVHHELRGVVDSDRADLRDAL